MANEPSQNPASPALELGLGGNTIGFLIRESLDEEPTAALEYVKDENGNDAVAVISNKGKRISVEGYLLDGQTVPGTGDVISVGASGSAVNFIVETCRVRKTATVNRVSLTIYKPAATTWTTGS